MLSLFLLLPFNLKQLLLDPYSTLAWLQSCSSSSLGSSTLIWFNGHRKLVKTRRSRVHSKTVCLWCSPNIWAQKYLTACSQFFFFFWIVYCTQREYKRDREKAEEVSQDKIRGVECFQVSDCISFDKSVYSTLQTFSTFSTICCRGVSLRLLSVDMRQYQQ